MNHRQPYHLQILADRVLVATCDMRRYPTVQPISSRLLQPLKGLQKPRAAYVSYRAFVPAGHAGCEVALSYQASSPDGENQKSSFKALPDNESIPATPPPFRHTPNHSWPQPTTTVWRNLQQNLQGLRIHYSSFIILHSSLSYTFSAKERDPKTGLSYFGSRYYSSDLSIWLSVDPMAAKYPSLSAYTYCANNPVRLVDPNGERFRLIGRKTNIAFRNYLLSYKGVDCENIYEAFSLDHNNSNVIMFKDPNITYKQFASHFYETTGEKLKNKDAKKLFNAIKSDVFIEANLVANEAISAAPPH